MNYAPSTPPNFQAIVPNPTSTMCGNFVNVILKLPLLLWQLLNWMLNSDGSVSTSFRQWIVRPGQIIAMAGSLPTNSDFLLCDGSEVLKSAYPDLYSAIGDVWGTASSASNFKLPDLRGQFLVGVGTFTTQGNVAIGQKVGADSVKLTSDQMPPHTHTVDGLYAVGLARDATKNGCSNSNANADASPFELTSNSTGGVGTPPAVNGHPNIPPAAGVFYYIAT